MRRVPDIEQDPYFLQPDHDGPTDVQPGAEEFWRELANLNRGTYTLIEEQP